MRHTKLYEKFIKLDKPVDKGMYHYQGLVMYNVAMEATIKKLLTVKEAANILGVTPLTLRNWDKNGKLSAGRHPLNNYRVYKREDIDRLLTDISTNREKRPTISSRKKTRKLEVAHLS